MKKPDHKSREAKAAQIRSVLDDNADLFEVRFLNQSTACVEWFEDVKDALCAFVTRSALSDKELQEKLTDKDHLKLVLLDELRAHGLNDGEADAVARLLRGLLVTSNRKHTKKEGCEELLRWLYNGQQDQTLLCVRVTENEFREMREQSAAGTVRMLATANAGSSLSNLSEAFSFELLTVLLSNRIELVKTETEIEYDDEQSKITDYLFETLAGERFGVSVTRACGKDFEARPLLVKKLFGVIESTRNVSQKDAWRKQLLHVWCETEAIAEAVRHCYEADVDPALKRDTFVLLTVVAEGQLTDALFYANEESAIIMRRGGITLGNVKSTFAKEIAKNRPSYDPEPHVSAAALACRSHDFFGDLLGGLRCQICDFETTGRVWKCSKGCDVALCGACMDKWKRKINEY